MSGIVPVTIRFENGEARIVGGVQRVRATQTIARHQIGKPLTMPVILMHSDPRLMGIEFVLAVWPNGRLTLRRADYNTDVCTATT